MAGKAIVDYGMISEGDRIMVAVSGGKDSLCMLRVLMHFQQVAPISFDLLAVNLDQGQPGHPSHVLPALFKEWNVPYHIEYRDTYSIVKEKIPANKSYCSLCSRLRRGVLYDLTKKMDCNRLALGHHADDLIETFLMNAFYSGQLASMSPCYLTEYEGLSVIRPLYMVHESMISDYVSDRGWPIVPCNLCGSQDGLKRIQTKELIESMSKSQPDIRSNIMNALSNVEVKSLLDERLWPKDI